MENGDWAEEEESANADLATSSLLLLSPPQRPLCVVGRLGRKKKRGRGARWEGGREKRSSRLFPLPIVRCALSIFLLLLFYRDIQREPLRRRKPCCTLRS